MPPSRTPKASTSARTLDAKPHARRPQQAAHEHVPGVQKIKSAIRQTTRLLAKDNLAADKRVEAERRLAALQDELARAEAARVERTMATKYHMVKFFERRKVERKIAQAKKAGDDGALFERRVDLNYILHFPKAEKYVALLKDGDSARRAELRARVAELMRAGALDAAPELAHAQTSGLLADAPKQETKPAKNKPAPDVAQDEFFASEGDDSDGSSSSS
ncbi:hypothetical protein AURDEDRAFT_161414 [Auricularia subglabra TFB-10046 SS5]|nr:hypothetical protein AURDEDRAFT_161414 [Auricularia subglabra TFB-10046 SS5]